MRRDASSSTPDTSSVSSRGSGSGWCVLAKRLEAGSFQLPPLDGDKPQVAIDGSTFASLLAGIDFTAARRGWYRRLPIEKPLKTIDTDLRV